MDPSRWWLLIGYLVTLCGSAFFSAAENALAAANKIRLRSWAEAGKRGAKTALGLLDRFDEALTGILIGNNIMNVAGASLATMFVFGLFRQAVEAGRVAEGTVTLIATVATTVMVFLLAEFTPKSLALAHPDGIAVALSPILRVLMTVLRPLTVLFGGIGHLTRRIFGGDAQPTVTEEELSAIFETAEEEGVVDEEQGDLLQSALEFSETTVADVLTMRDDMVCIKLGMGHERILEIFDEYKYSRFPVYENDLDHIVGILQVRTYLKANLKRERMNLRELCSPVFYTTLDAGIHELLEKMSRAKVTMAVVRDPESGHVQGLVTVEDFLEELVGEIFDEDDVVNDRFMKLGGNYFRVSAGCTMGEMFHEMSYRGRVNMSRVKTVGTWVCESLGHAPEADDEFTWRDLTVRVTDLDEQGKLTYVEVKLADPELDGAVPQIAAPDGEVTA